MKKIIIPSLVDTYGLIKFWDFDCGIDLVSFQVKNDFKMHKVFVY